MAIMNAWGRTTQLSSNEAIRLDAQREKNHMDDIKKKADEGENDQEKEYVNEVYSAIESTFRNLATARNGLNLNFTEVTELRDKQVENLEYYTTFSHDLQSLIPRLSSMTIGGVTGGVLISSLVESWFPSSLKPYAMPLVLAFGAAIGYLVHGMIVVPWVKRQKQGEVIKSEKLVLTTSYPVLKGPTDTKFEFSVEVDNKTDKDSIFNLSSQAPENWEVNFKPAYEDKFFSSLRIKAGQSQTMAVAVNPFALAEPGEYPVKIRVSSENAKAEAELVVILTGTYKLDTATSNGLLSLNAVQGEPANLSFFVRNSGSATQTNIRFLSFKPENWDVKFEPENIDTLAPGDLKQVELTVTPSEQALVGDYSVAVRVEGEKANQSMELRTTVRASTAWGVLGIIIIVLVIAGLVVLFIRMGRR